MSFAASIPFVDMNRNSAFLLLSRPGEKFCLLSARNPVLEALLLLLLVLLILLKPEGNYFLLFQHYGILHVALSCWVLLNFGPQVCKGYGSCILLLYILGGISGNLTSFIHTLDPTVGEMGPTFAIIGAWLMYQIQNKATIQKEASENMFWHLFAAFAYEIASMAMVFIDKETVMNAYDRAAIKFGGVEADINFSLDDYQADLKQMGSLTKEEFDQDAPPVISVPHLFFTRVDDVGILDARRDSNGSRNSRERVRHNPIQEDDMIFSDEDTVAFQDMLFLEVQTRERKSGWSEEAILKSLKTRTHRVPQEAEICSICQGIIQGWI